MSRQVERRHRDEASIRSASICAGTGFAGAPVIAQTTELADHHRDRQRHRHRGDRLRAAGEPAAIDPPRRAPNTAPPRHSSHGSVAPNPDCAAATRAPSGVPTGSGTNAGVGRRQIDDARRPLHPRRGRHAAFVARVVPEAAAAGAGHHRRQPDADEQRGDHDRAPAARARGRPGAGGGNRQRRQQRHQESRGSAHPRPPHRERRHREQIRQRHDAATRGRAAGCGRSRRARSRAPARWRAGRTPGRTAARRARSAGTRTRCPRVRRRRRRIRRAVDDGEEEHPRDRARSPAAQKRDGLRHRVGHVARGGRGSVRQASRRAPRTACASTATAPAPARAGTTATRIASVGRASYPCRPCRPWPSSSVASSLPLRALSSAQNPGEHDDAAEAVGIDGVGLEQPRRGERERGPAEPRGLARCRSRATPATTPARTPRRTRGAGTATTPAIAADRERRQHDRRHARRVDRIDGAVAPALDRVRIQIAGEVGAVVAALMVVLDLQVVVVEQALRDDEVVRLVAAGNRRRREPRGASQTR